MKRPDEELAQQLAKYLNELKDLDNAAIFDMVETRFAVNKDMVEHPTVQITGSSDDGPVLGLLGLLNGFLGIYGKEHPLAGYGPLAVRESTDKLKIIEFGLTKDIFASDRVSDA